MAAKTPDRLLTLPIDIHQGITDEVAGRVADFLKFGGGLREKVRLVFFIDIVYEYFMLCFDMIDVSYNEGKRKWLFYFYFFIIII